jgi:hypothetical protein
MDDGKDSMHNGLNFKTLLTLFLVLTLIISPLFAQKISLIQYPDEVVKGEKFAVKLNVYAEPKDTILIIASSEGEVNLSESFIFEDSSINIEPLKANPPFALSEYLQKNFPAQRVFIFLDTLKHSSVLRSYAFVMSTKSSDEIRLNFLPIKISSDSLILEPMEAEGHKVNIKVKNYLDKTAGLCAKFEKDGFIKFNLNDKFTGKEGFTLLFWLKTTSMMGKIITLRSTFDKSFVSVGLKFGSIFVSMNSSIGKYEITFPKFVSDGKWHCIVITANQPGDVLKLYVDGDKIDEIFIPNLSQFEINRPSVKIEKGLIDEIVLFKNVKPELVERLWRYFVKVDTNVLFLLKFENEEVNVIGNVSNIETNAVKFVPSSAPIYSPGVKVNAELKEGKINIGWEVEDPEFVSRFVLERKIKDGQFQPVYQILASDFNKYTFVDVDVEDNVVYFYRVKRINKDGSFEFSDEIKVGVGLKKDFEIIGNFPNPFNSETKIIYTLFSDTYVKLTVYDIVGREIAVLVDGFQNAGKHEVSFNLGNIKVDEITSGIYLYKLQTQKGYEIRKMVVIK